MSDDNAGRNKIGEVFFARWLTLDISPVQPIFLGSGPKHLVDPGVERLEASFFWLQGKSDENQLLFVSVDALYPGSEIRKWILDQLGDLLEDSQIFITASHTHNAPMLDRDKPELNDVVEKHVQRVRKTVIDGLKKLRNLTRIEVGVKVAEFTFPKTVSRRKKSKLAFGKNGFERNKIVFASQRLDVPSTGSSVVFSDGRLDVAALVIFDCHPVSHPVPNSVSSHYIGHLRSGFRNRETSDSDGAFMFMQGASGEIRPDSLESPSKLLSKLMNFCGVAPRFRSFTWEEYQNWTDGLLEIFLSSLDSASPIKANATISSARSTFGLSEFYCSSTETSPSMSISVVSTPFLEIIGISAEVTQEYGSEFFLSHPPPEDNVLRRVVGCTDHTYGYLCSSRQLVEGGYEATGWMPYFSIKPKERFSEVPERGKDWINQTIIEARGRI